MHRLADDSGATKIRREVRRSRRLLPRGSMIELTRLAFRFQRQLFYSCHSAA